MSLLFALIGALFNHIRGGLLTTLRMKELQDKGYTFAEAEQKAESRFKSLGKQANHIVFAILFTLALLPLSPLQAVVSLLALYAGMFAGAAPGWGTYIDDMINKKISGRPEINFIDAITIKGATNYPVLRNCIALSLRGLLWTFFISIGFYITSLVGAIDQTLILRLLPLGLLMGPTYLLAMEICERITSRGNGWQIGEYFWGFVLWGGIAILIGV